VHPGAGQKDATLINGLLHMKPKQRELPRYGLVHRLDKDTSGLMLLAKTIQSHTILTDLIQNKEIKRNYYALVHGKPISGKTIDLPIGRHPKNRLLFCVKEGGRSAVTHFKVKDRYKNFSLLDVELETGRTHQIRVHLKHIGHPIVGDKSYNNIKIWKDADPKELKAVTDLDRQALHSYNLALTYLSEEFNFKSELPSDFTETCIKLEK
jgi:23S rRNA pseudouridine1911/1915/1917 synthase